MQIVDRSNLEASLKLALSPENNPKRNFVQSVEIIVTFKEVDMKKGDLKLREIVVLPKPPEKTKKVLVVPTIQQLEYAKKAEPNTILTKEELQKLQGNKRAIKKIARQNDWFLIAPDSMALVGRILGPALGPRGKFPTPLPNTADISEYILRFKRSTLVKTKDQPQTQVFIGTESQQIADLAENALAVLNVIESKGYAQKVRNIYVKTTMGKVVKVELR
ncbi:50S ribosomal protein L1 [Saccharolobus solfataricus]|uniref:Large ribosomal subunit protein uL1 n=3 Tax=Saccharolobus solfataricus TaxID=2287 RepID=RL1_SACS2|nr:50S ribosomal protein L1 [Saccharolobus solfataricus]P96038.1 RecName: Full=Large ribosomal subunit protein uL1; AltName: Full=50S ribosomal protein L1 [Saccharolobus solfataricus P2]AAB99525.1 ribosomal protein L1 [Saccharolobus solfataricus]AAK40674.1 LSU ribosomal protein L1AB (rpl1AB) [Saccharolobus solfataricus P2]AKA73652.1 50S ribosomal protein L1 [Saccharolobus solfataricus]AKA76349.1 50S ribosomal protein L1 [Saccharolobus solfataricus]AKA79041.1 50S ribosomal protein L1 [Saccharo